MTRNRLWLLVVMGLAAAAYCQVGPGRADEYTCGVFLVGNGVSPAALIEFTLPEYPERASKNRYGGAVIIALDVTESGEPKPILWRALGMGLDEVSMQAVRQWKFAPGTREGKAVRIAMFAEFIFEPGANRVRARLLNSRPSD